MGQVEDEGKLLLNSAFLLSSLRWRLVVGDPPPPSSFSLLHPVLTSSPLPPALAHKSAVVYENLQHSDVTLRADSSPYWSQPIT